MISRFFTHLTVYTLTLLAPVTLCWAMAKSPPAEYREQVVTQEILTPLTLEDCYHLALQRSEIVGISKESIAKANALFFQATSVALGDVDFVSTDFRQDAPKSSDGGGSTSSIGSTYTAADRRERKFVISQPLFQGFKSVGAVLGAGSLKTQRKEEWIRTKQVLFSNVASAFYNVLRYQKDVQTLEADLKAYLERIDELDERAKIGRSRESEIANARSHAKITEGDLAVTRASLAIAEEILEYLIGRSVKSKQLVEENLETDVPLPLTEYLHAIYWRPDVKAAKAALKVAKQNIVVTQSAFWPTISLSNNEYIKREGFQSGISWDLLLTLDVPLSRGGDNIGKFKAAISDWKTAKLNYSLVKRQAELDIKTSYENWVSSNDKFQSWHEAAKAAEENFRLQKEDYAKNLVSNLDVLTALDSLLQTQLNENLAYYQMKIYYWSLKVATGEDL